MYNSKNVIPPVRRIPDLTGPHKLSSTSTHAVPLITSVISRLCIEAELSLATRLQSSRLVKIMVHTSAYNTK